VKTILKNLLPIMLSFFVITGCERDKDKVVRTPEEEHILELAYSKDYSYPVGFYHEVNDTGSPYYENTVSIMPINGRQNIWIELNTNDKNEARIWSDKSNAYSSVNREIIGERESDKYFEFTRKNIQYSNDILLSRVHKSSYFQPVKNKFFTSDTLIGKFNGELNLTTVKELVEYLWICGTMGVSYSKVSESEIKEYNDHFEYYIQSIVIVHGDFGIHDEIIVYDNFATLNKSDRELKIKTNKVKTIQGTQR
jgi:hypothetical protein